MNERPDYLDYRLDGWNLIEAAAGTGKTYTIQNLAVRFLLERRLPIRSLLVVTFTEAAAAELKERIRAVLGTMLDAATGAEPAPERERLLLERAAEAGVPREACAGLLKNALSSFDDAAISTIHGFCARVLGENAFESGVLFRSELVKDTSGMIAELGMDFYRRIFYAPGPKLRNAMAEAAGITPESLTGPAKLKAAHPELVIRTPLAGTEEEAELILREAESIISELQNADLAGALAEAAPYLNKLGNFAAADAPAAAEAALREPDTAEALKCLSGLGLSVLETKVKKRLKGTTPEEVKARLAAGPFRLADRLAELVRDYGNALKLAAAAFIRHGFEQRRKRENFQTFNDLLQEVHHALHAASSPLPAVLRQRYPVGIVDEFQDTDPVQYEIFTSIFRPPEGTLYMVGDPRQAIYAFRGGDIAVYRRAVRELEAAGGRKYTLTANYRSAAAMIADVNTLFHRHADPFADPSITFPEVRAPEPAPALLRNGVPEAHPLRIIRLPDANEAECRSRTARAVLELLSDPSLALPGRGESGIRPRDIAILVLRGYEAELLAAELHALHIPAVFTRTGNIFGSEDARELLTVLRAVASNDVRRLPNLLATPIGGMPVAAIAELQTERGERELAEEQTKLRELQTIWENGSFIEFFNALLTARQVRKRYPALPRGERKLTNLLQLGDLLEQESARRGLSPAGVADFLAERIADPDKGDGEEYQQLLETDREAVTLMTIHGSKGLEFPIVLLPGLHLGDAEKRAELFHNAGGKLEYDLTDSPEGRRKAQDERLQELLRLAYVAVTRAKHHCRIFWGKGPKATAPDWLFRMREAGARGTSPVQALLADPPEPQIPAELLDPETAPEPPPFYRQDPGATLELELPPVRLGIDSGWQFVSYSSLSPQGGADTPYDYDEKEQEPGTPGEPPDGGIFAVRGGAAAGNAWHRIFELADFSAGEEELRALALPQLTDFGLLRGGEDPEEKLKLTVRMAQDVFRSPLRGADGVAFRLAEVPRRERLSELEFAYRFRSGFTTKQLRRLLERYAAERFGLSEWPVWNRTVSGGCLNGFIDLFFRHHGRYFILDWKSNRLGGRSANFLPERLPAAMAGSFYFLQYLIYTVAAVKYLRMRLGRFDEAEYESLFGGVFYLFVRGVSPDHPGRGVFHDKPPYELVRQLEELIG